MAQESVGDIIHQLENAHGQMEVALDGVSEDDLHNAPAGEWSIAEICAHVIEMGPMWMSKVLDIDNVPDLERTSKEIDRRTAEVTAHSSDDLSTIMQRMASAHEETIRLAQQIDSVHMGKLTNLGTVGEAITDKLVAHVIEHAEQIKATRVSAN